MGLETGTYINSLVATNPLSTDLRSTADDHLRLIKSTVKATWPNVSGAVTPTHTEFNYVGGVTSAIQTQLDAVVASAAAAATAAARRAIIIDVGDETTNLTTGTAKKTFRMPFAMTVTEVRASVATAPTGATLLTVDINDGGTTILSTKLTFDASEKTTTTATTPPVISDSALADDAEITIDIDAIGSTTPGRGLRVYLIGASP